MVGSDYNVASHAKRRSFRMRMVRSDGVIFAVGKWFWRSAGVKAPIYLPITRQTSSTVLARALRCSVLSFAKAFSILVGIRRIRPKEHELCRPDREGLADLIALVRWQVVKDEHPPSDQRGGDH